MHKVLFGDPYQLKEKDILKRKKTSLSPNSTTPISPVYDQNMRKKGNILSDGYELKEGDLGFVEYSDHAETSTVADIVTKSKISSIEVPNTYKNKEQLDHLLKEYGAGKIEVTDGSAYGNMNFFKELMGKQGNWSKEMDILFENDTALARYEGSLENNYTYSDIELRERDREYWSEFNKNGARHISEATLSIIKPIASGAKNNSSFIDAVVDKYSIFPLTYETARKYPDLKKLYYKMNTQRDSGKGYTDYVIFASGRKVGTDTVDPLYNSDGKFNEEPFTSDVHISHDSLCIIAEVAFKGKDKKTLGTQLRNLGPIDLFSNGNPTGNTEEERNRVKEKVDKYQDSHKQLVIQGFNRLLVEWGVDTINPDSVNVDDKYEIRDKGVISELLQSEMLRRLLPDNVKDAVKTYIDEDGNEQFIAPPEATPAYKSIVNIIMSKVDKAFKQPKVSGTDVVQASVGGFSDGITKDENGNLVSDQLKFYEP
ncbi:MAG TPA: hypothetical protein VK031_03285, partial [Tissierellaceae bacterium]|nr:hypothetical protein [Tissierellaceae bacterium]